MSRSAARGDDFVSEVVAQVGRVLKGAGAEESTVVEAAKDIEKRLRDTFGGQVFYVAKYAHRDLHAEICAQFTGSNHAELASQFKLTMPSIYRILKRWQAEQRALQRASAEPPKEGKQ